MRWYRSQSIRQSIVVVDLGVGRQGLYTTRIFVGVVDPLHRTTLPLVVKTTVKSQLTRVEFLSYCKIVAVGLFTQRLSGLYGAPGHFLFWSMA